MIGPAAVFDYFLFNRFYIERLDRLRYGRERQLHGSLPFLVACVCRPERKDASSTRRRLLNQSIDPPRMMSSQQLATPTLHDFTVRVVLVP